MARIVQSTILPAPVDRVWSLLREGAWRRAEREEPADKVGAASYVRLSGGRFCEQLLSLSDRERRLRYFLAEAPIALRDFVGELHIAPVTSDGQTWCEWRAEFDPPAGERDRLLRFVREEVVAGGLAAIRRALESEQAPVSQPRSAQGEAVAVVLTRYGGPEVLQLRGMAPSAPGPGEARLRQTAIGVNFIDVYCRRGSFNLVPPGGIVGMEAAGVVESVGAGVVDVRPGDRVAYACAPPGSYATVRNMPADMLVKLPPELSDRQAAALMLKGITASFLLHDVYAVKAGDVVVVHAAAGGVGQILCRWAKALGASVIGVVSTPAKAAVAAESGCDLTILSSDRKLVDEVRRFAGGVGANVVYDAVGADTFDLSVACLAPRGALVSFGQASGDVGARSIDQLATRSVTLSRPNYAHYTDTAEKLAAQSARLFAALWTGAVVATPPRVYPLAEVARAHADLEGRRTTGAVVLTP